MKVWLVMLAGLAAMCRPAENLAVAVQIVNADAPESIRVFLDRKPIYEGASAVPAVAGSFPLDRDARHVLMAEARGTRTKAQLEWTPRAEGGKWVVIRYYPGRSEPGEPPFFTFHLQSEPAKLK